MTSASLLEVRDLVVCYGNHEAVHRVSLEVRSGEVVGLIGPDGAGKTSTLRVLGGLLQADSGSATAFGEDCWRERRSLHTRLGYLAQRFALYGDLTVDENIQFFALMYGVPDWRTRRRKLLELVGLAPFHDRLADRLSGGMKQKLALACTLIHSPRALLLDEPTTGVDPVTRREFWRLLADLVSDGLTLLIATPYLDEAERCTRVLLMHEGTILADARPQEIPDLMPGTVIEITASPRAAAIEALRTLDSVVDVSVFGTTLHAHLVGATDPGGSIREALARRQIDVESTREVPAGLEDTFLYLTRTATASHATEASWS
ncbi:MAG: ABC transporter ATP-binding protein [Acidobacteria bacterium]|nr:ABC transporter ATP-binding protein [Acidobacteriota bacterium]